MSVAPYPGLRPYDEEERDNFFGRETDSKILIDQILANRLTLLFAATGVGKSSLLRASVIPRLKEPLGENLDVVFFNDWVAPPLPNLKRVILTTLHEQGDLEQDVIAQEVVDAPLGGFLEFCCLFTSQPFLIVLDQFEEFFRYRGNYPKEHSQALIDQLTEVILNKAIPVAVVLSMREDYALELNDFKPRLPMILFENYYRLEKLTREAAMDAIQIPAQRVGFKYEGVLFELLLKDLLSRELDRSKGSMVADTIETVEPPYLQIICSQLWMRDQNDPEKTIRYTTYEKAGGAKGLLDNFIGQDVMSKFSFAEKQLASKAFDHLVSRRGTKMPHTVEDLSQMLDVNADELRKVLDKLEQNRVLRSQQREKKVWYELYHDMFSHSIDDWNTAWKNRMRVRRSIIGGISLAAFGVAVLVGYDTWVNATSSHLRMSLSDPYSMVELWKGKQGSWDLFGQQRFLSQMNQQVKDREPDKRLPQWAINNNDELAAEVIGTLPLQDRVTAFAQDGQYARALKVAKDAISDTEVAQSKAVITNVASIQIAEAIELLWERLPYLGRESLRNAIDEDLSPMSVAYWLEDEEVVALRMQMGNAQQKILLADKLGKLVLVSGKEALSALVSQLKNDESADVRSSMAQVLRQSDNEEVLLALLSHLKNDKSDDVRSSVAQVLGYLGRVEALPLLMSQLKNDESTDVRSSVAKALGELGSDEALPLLMSQLKNDEFADVRSSVAQALGDLGSVDALPALVSQLEDVDENVRKNVSEALGKLGSVDALPALLSQLKDEDWKVRHGVTQALGQLGSKEALPALLSQLKDENWRVRQGVIQVLGQLGRKEALPALLSQLKDKNWNVRQGVTQALGQLVGEDALPELLSQLKDDEDNVRSSVAEVLGQLGNEEALPALLPQLRDENPDVRLSVARALGWLGSEQALPELLSQLKVDHNWEVRQSIEKVMGQLVSEEALPVLLSQLNDDDRRGHSSVVWALGQLASGESLPVLLSQLKDDDEDVRANVAEALGELGSMEALPALMSQLKDDDRGVRSNVAQALGKLGRFEALPALVAQLKDDDPYVRSSVVGALVQLGGKEALPALLSQLETYDSNERSSVAEALGQLGGSEVLPALFPQLKDEYFQVRAGAAQALGHLGHVESLPVLLSQLKDNNSGVCSSVALALGQLRDEQALPALISLFTQKKQSNLTKVSTALSLVSFDHAESKTYLIEGLNNLEYSERYLSMNPYENWEVVLKDIFLKGNDQNTAFGKLLLEQFNEKRPISAQVIWIQAFVASDVKEALPILYRLLESSNNVRIKKAAQAAIASLESDYPKLLAMTENPKLKVSDRLQALATLVVKHQQTAIPDLLRLLKADEKLYGRKIWRMLGELKAPEAKALLETRIDEIKQGYANWRDIRDDEPQVAEEETKEQNPAWKQWKEKLDASKPAYAAHYAHALARIDPETGIKLLEHEIADIRQGAWYGLASLADINLVKQLTDLRLRSHDQPLLRHAAYRAIDLSLTTIQHNNKPEDLQALEAWYPTLKQQEMQQEEVKTEDELSITPRVDWTIHLISYNLKAKAELQRRYQVFVAEQKKKTDGQAPQQIQ